MKDANRTTLITGATSGLGRWLAHRLTKEGWKVLVHGRDAARLQALARELSGTQPFVADLASLAGVRRLAEAVMASAPRLDVLVNNAGVGFGRPGEERQVSRDGHELRMAVNYLAPVLLTRLLMPRLVASAPSRIVNVGSLGQVPFDVADIEFERGWDGTEAYRRAKLALAAFTFDLPDELRGTGVTANCLHPATFMETAMVVEAGVAPHSTVEDGGEATLRLITDPALAEVTGEFFNGSSPSRALALAYDPAFRQELREATDRMIA